MQVDRESGRRKELFFLFFSKLLRSIVPSIKIEHSVFFFNEVSFDLTNGKEEKKLTIMCMFSLEVKEGRDLCFRNGTTSFLLKAF